MSVINFQTQSKSCWSKQFQNTFTTRSLLHTSTVTHLVRSDSAACLLPCFHLAICSQRGSWCQSGIALLCIKCPLAFHCTQGKPEVPAVASEHWATPPHPQLSPQPCPSAAPILLEPRWPHSCLRVSALAVPSAWNTPSPHIPIAYVLHQVTI